MSIKKKFLKNKPVCKTTFELSKDVVAAAQTVYVLGDFNGWQPTHPMKALKNGGFSATIDLASGQEYQFRYFIDNARWENDPEADRLVTSIYGDSQNSVVAV